MSTLGQLLSSRRKRMVCFVRRAEMSLSVRCCQTTEFFGTHPAYQGPRVRRNQRRGLAEYFVSSYPKPMQANTTTKGYSMWALVIFTIATTGPAASTVTSLAFVTQHLCLIAERQLESLTEPVVSEGLVRYEVVATCVQVSEASAKK